MRDTVTIRNPYHTVGNFRFGFWTFLRTLTHLDLFTLYHRTSVPVKATRGTWYRDEWTAIVAIPCPRWIENLLPRRPVGNATSAGFEGQELRPGSKTWWRPVPELTPLEVREEVALERFMPIEQLRERRQARYV